jgi:hypothetical protein
MPRQRNCLTVERDGLRKMAFAARQNESMPHPNVHGFTLIELLVFIAVVPLYALLPGSVKSEGPAQRIQCVNNLIRLGLRCGFTSMTTAFIQWEWWIMRTPITFVGGMILQHSITD